MTIAAVMNKERIWTLLSRKLSGEATSSELSELNTFIHSNPGIDLTLPIIEEFWTVPIEKEDDFLEATYHLHLNRLKEKGHDLRSNKEEAHSFFMQIPPTPGRKKKFKKLFLASSLAIAVVLPGLGYLLNNRHDTTPAENKVNTSEVSTKNGSRTKIQLPDGTSVWLNGSSKLVYDNSHFGEHFREVTLTGEGYFDVVKNPAKPFIIHTNKMDIKVMGTAFNVKCYPGEKNTETSLVHGSIEVTLKDRLEKIILKPNEKLVISNEENGVVKTGNISKDQKQIPSGPIIAVSHLTIVPKDNSIAETAWVENKLVFSDEPFEDIALKMERWYGVQIIFANDMLKSIHMTGNFEKETVYEALNALQIATPFNYRINKDNIIISK